MRPIGEVDGADRYIAPVPTLDDAPLVLLPPSEGKAAGGRRQPTAGTFSRSLARPRAQVREALGATLAAGGPPERVLGVRGALLEAALDATRRVVAGRPLLLPAWERYTGVVWGHLDAATLSAGDRERILVPSGLYGITTAEDPIADYRLKLSVSLTGLGGLARFWRPIVTEALCRVAAGRTIVTMLPVEHAAVVDEAVLGEVCDVVDVRFLDDRGSRTVGHAAKAAKGAAARTLLLGGLPALERFRFEGWRAECADDHLAIISPPGASS